MSKHILKRKAFADSAKVSFQNTDQSHSNTSFSTEKMLPSLEEPNNDKPFPELKFSRNYQNVHPLLAKWQNTTQKRKQKEIYSKNETIASHWTCW